MGRNPFGSRKPTRDTGPLAASPFPHLEEEIPNVTPEDSGIRAHIENIPTANFQPKKRTDKRQRARSRFMQLIEANLERVTRIADTVEVANYEIVRLALEHGLQEIQEGKLSLEPVFAKGALTLFPDTSIGIRRRQRQKLVNVSYRHIPDETWEAVKALAEVVPLWQVINRLLEHTLSQIEQQKLELTPQRVKVYTLYPGE